jgi:hypothetical protein
MCQAAHSSVIQNKKAGQHCPAFAIPERQN